MKADITYSDGRYTVGILWNDAVSELPDNYAMACSPVQHREAPDVAKSYADTISKYLQKGYIRKVFPEEAEPDRTWYLPHFVIVKADRTTTKTRIVFDASASCNGVSLNDRIHTRPKLQLSLLDVLLRFRHHPIALVCDIAEMYLQIQVKEEDRPCLRFLWRNLDDAMQPEEYEFTRVVFDVNALPFLAQYVSQEHARNHSSKHPRAADTITMSTYSEKSPDDAIELYHELSQMWASAGMRARKLLSNSPEVMQHIPAEDLAKEIP